MTQRVYHVLVEWDITAKRWTVEFGDYDKKVVQQELRDHFESGRWSRGLRKKNLSILTVNGDTEADIQRDVAILNSHGRVG